MDAYGYCPWNSVPCPDGCWTPIADNDYIVGSFDWTGFDYKGEPTPRFMAYNQLC